MPMENLKDNIDNATIWYENISISIVINLF